MCIPVTLVDLGPRRARRLLLAAVLAAGTVLSAAPSHTLAGQPRADDTSYLLSIAVDKHGLVYFGEDYALGVLDPRTRRVRAYPIDPYGGAVSGIAVSPRGTIWYTQGSYDNSLHSVSLAGCGGRYPLQSPDETPSSVGIGPDGHAWFTSVGGPGVGTIVHGSAKEYVLPTAKSGPFSIITGPDGNLWFTEYLGNTVDRVTPGGKVTEFHMPIARLDPAYLTVGPDGALWFTSDGGLARMTLKGAISVVNPDLGVADLARGPGRSVWMPLDSQKGPALLRIGADGVVHAHLLPHGHTLPAALATAPDGSLWFTEPDSRQIVHLTNDGALHRYPVTLPTQKQAAALPLALCGPTLTEIPGITSHAVALPDAARQARDVEGQNPFNVASLAGAPDGSVWLTEPMRDAVVHLRKDGTSKAYVFPIQDCGCAAAPQDLAITAGGIAFATDSGNTIDRIDPTTDITTTYDYGTKQDSVFGIIAAPDGNLYFGDENSADYLVRMAPDATSPGQRFTAFTLPVKDEQIAGLTLGFGHTLWVAGNTDGSAIFSRFNLVSQRFTATFTQTEEAPAITGLHRGPDGALWYVDGGFVGRVSDSGTFTHFPIPSSGTAMSSNPNGLVRGSSNDLWFADPGTTSLGRVSMNGTITEYRLPHPAHGAISGPEAIAAGPGGTLWYVAAGAVPAGSSKIRAPKGDTLVHLTLPATIPVPAAS
jgi:streptogramin lyase